MNKTAKMTSKLNLKEAQNQITNTVNKLTNHKHSGSILVATSTEIIYKKCFGHADFSKKILVSANSQFLAGSVTKQFAAVAILKAFLDKSSNENTPAKNKEYILKELNNTIEYYLPIEHEIWNGLMPTWAKNVTIHQLLVHSSGIINYTSIPGYENQKFSKSSDLIAFFKNYELEFSPGEKFAYSNSGYYLLGLIIQQITQQNLDVYLEQTFFKPLKMLSTFLPTQGTVDDLIRADARFANLARGYQYEAAKQSACLEEVKRYEPMENPGGAGGLISTTEDLVKWNRALYAGKIIPKFLLELMLKPYILTERTGAYYGYGIEIMQSQILGQYYTHRGGIPGFRSILTFIPSLKISIVTMQNIISDQANIMPEIEEIKSSLSKSSSQEESLAQLVKIIEGRYPSIIENRMRYEFAPVYEEIIKTMETKLVFIRYLKNSTTIRKISHRH